MQIKKIHKQIIGIAFLFSLLLIPGCLGFDFEQNDPPGTDGSSINNATLLVESHRSILDKNEHMIYSEKKNLLGESQLLYRADNSDKQAYVQVTNDDDTIDVFFNEDGWYKRSENFMGTDYKKGESEGTFEKYNSKPTNNFAGGYFGQITNLEHTIRNYEYNWENNTVEGKKNYTRLKITGKRASNHDKDLNGYILIRNDGFIREFVVNSEGINFRIEYKISEDLDVNQPVWKNKADSQSTEDSGGTSGVLVDYDCDDFGSQAAAQDVHESSGGAHGLDGDGDGIACEALP